MNNLDRVINFNVSNSRFIIKYQTLMKELEYNKDSLLVIESKNKEDIYIERDPEFFKHIINYFFYKNEELKLPENNDLKFLLNEAVHFKLNGLVRVIKDRLHSFSNILTDNQFINLINTIKKDSAHSILYRATRDGFSAKDFHFNCDEIGNTLTIIQTTKNKVFGGYTSEKWSSNEGGKYHGFQNGQNCFIFKQCNRLFDIMKCKPNKPAIYNNPNLGPTFGEGHEICIKSNSNSNYQSYSHLGITYNGQFKYKDKNSRIYLAGEKNFKNKEIEIFRIFFK